MYTATDDSTLMLLPALGKSPIFVSAHSEVEIGKDIPLNARRQFACLAKISNESIMIMNGFDKKKTPVYSTFLYSLSTKKWHQGPKSLSGRAHSSCEAVDDTGCIYI